MGENRGGIHQPGHRHVPPRVRLAIVTSLMFAASNTIGNILQLVPDLAMDSMAFYTWSSFITTTQARSVL